MKWKAAGLACALVAASAHAQCREDVEARLETLAVAFDDQIKGLRIWSYSWGSIYGTVALTQGVIATAQGQRHTSNTDLWVGTISAGVGSLSFFLLPLRFLGPLERVRAQWDDPDRCGLLARAEATRAKVDHDQHLGKSWIGHAGNVLVNIGITLLLGLVYGHWQAGLISGGVGIAIGEVNLISQPTKLGLVSEPEPPAVRVVPIVSRELNGAGLVVIF